MQDVVADLVIINQKRKSRDSSYICIAIDVQLAMLELAPTLEEFVKAGDFSILPHTLANPIHVAALARQNLSKTKNKFKKNQEVFENLAVETPDNKGNFPVLLLDCHHAYRMDVFHAMVQVYYFSWVKFSPSELKYGEYCILSKPLINIYLNFGPFEPEEMDRTLGELGIDKYPRLNFYSGPTINVLDYNAKDLWEKLSGSNPHHEFAIEMSERNWKPWLVFVVSVIASQPAGYQSSNEIINASKEKFGFPLNNIVFYNCVVWLRKHNVLENTMPLRFTPKAAEAISGLEQVKKPLYYFPGFHWLSWLTNPPIVSEFILTPKVPQMNFPTTAAANFPVAATTTIHAATAAFGSSIVSSNSAIDTKLTSEKSNEKTTSSNKTLVGPTFTPALNAAAATKTTTTATAVASTVTNVPTMEIEPAGTNDICISINGSSMDLN
jgi:hypothetical protein